MSALARYELLNLRRRRSLVASITVLTIGAVAIAITVLAIQHANSPLKNPPAGGEHNLSHEVFLLWMLGGLGAVLVGATAGAGDLSAGMFRDFVLTGRSRTRLYLSRIAPALAVILSILWLAFAVAATASVVLSDPAHAAPSLALIVQYGGWLTLSTTLSTIIAVGIAAVVGSQTIAITALLAWQLIITPSLIAANSLGRVREILLGSALGRLHPGPFPAHPPVAMPIVTSLVVIAAWTIVPLGLGARAVSRRDA